VLLVASSDMSHYYQQDEANQLDAGGLSATCAEFTRAESREFSSPILPGDASAGFGRRTGLSIPRREALAARRSAHA